MKEQEMAFSKRALMHEKDENIMIMRKWQTFFNWLFIQISLKEICSNLYELGIWTYSKIASCKFNGKLYKFLPLTKVGMMLGTLTCIFVNTRLQVLKFNIVPSYFFFFKNNIFKTNFYIISYFNIFPIRTIYLQFNATYYWILPRFFFFLSTQ